MGLASGQALVLRRRINRICSIFWTLTVVPALSSSSLASSTIRKAAALHVHIYYFSLFFFLLGRSRFWEHLPACCYTYRRTFPKHTYYYYILVHAHICFSYIYMYTYYYLLFSHIYIYEHIATRALTYIHTHTPFITIYVYSYIFTHNYTYII